MTEMEKLDKEIYNKIEELENKYHIPSNIHYYMDDGFRLKGSIEDVEEFVKVLVKNVQFHNFIDDIKGISQLVKKKFYMV